ncbi:hypothetical protein [Citrobacter sp.]|uniref:hypothetical protein n=1 Tax=Citrobacter sp. TaxID=1896336 RepID=UPI002FC7A713
MVIKQERTVNVQVRELSDEMKKALNPGITMEEAEVFRQQVEMNREHMVRTSMAALLDFAKRLEDNPELFDFMEVSNDAHDVTVTLRMKRKIV